MSTCLAQDDVAVTTQLDKTVSSMRQAFGVPSVAVAVINNGHLIYAKAFGESDINKAKPATPETRYAVGSISKQFTAASLLLEQEAGKVSLEDKVGKYLPELTRANDVTIRELLSHTSGYEDYAPQDYLIPSWIQPTTPEAILNNWAKKPLNFEPGTQWQYSNTNYVIAGTILERVAGQKLLPFLQEHFFSPLAMSSAADCDVKSPEDAASYTRYALGPPRPVGREGAGWYFAAGELCMTPSDLAKWDEAFLSRKILSPQSYDEFTREVKLKNGKGTHYALGLDVEEWKGTRRISHSGEVSGFLASNTIFPEKHAGVVVLTNEDGVNLIGPLSQEISSLLVDPAFSANEKVDAQVRDILEDLQKGEVPRERLTENANSYFSQKALRDYQDSLAPLGKLEVLSRLAMQQRGGMTHLSYRAHFQKDTVSLNIYVMPDGKFEQFMVEEQF
ncbi:MAG TPA: serine hydrolase domain-containing protein [Bryobacteraceae bacterium]|nr:serine hydrolase domain-containing protein [Bryobacteraceae bacterium]